mmetsp:Transcript_25921/g.46985  ORF Transcript_25921/g.46985 Transcript_25921/m.46985 type:complete len:449 (-) Transcript_25921:265-1611(-)
MGESTKKGSSSTMPHHLTLIKLAIFFQTASQAGWSRFSSIYMLSQGFTPSQIGRIKSTSQIAKALAQPIWGVMSDITDPLSTIIVSTVLGAVTLAGVREAIDAQSFSKLTTWRIIRSAATAASPALDALVLRLVEKSSEGYGPQRLWGSVAWGLSSLCAGAILDRFGEGAIFGYTYVISGVLLAFFLALRRVIPRSSTKRSDDESPQKKESQSTGLMLRVCGFIRTVISDLSRGTTLTVWAILIHSFGYGVIMVLFNTILMLQLERDFGISRSVQGIFTLVSILSTLPVYHYSSKLRERIGHLGMIQSSIIVATFRLCLTRFACSEAVSDGSRAKWLLLLQLLHGYHFAADWVASVELLDTLASQRLRSSMQFLLNMAYFTAGSGIGNLWFGVLYEQQGGRTTYTRGLWFCLIDFAFISALKAYNTRVMFTRNDALEVGMSEHVSSNP